MKLLLSALVVGVATSCSTNRLALEGTPTGEQLYFTRADKPKRLDVLGTYADTIIGHSLEANRGNAPTDGVYDEFAEAKTEILWDKAQGDTTIGNIVLGSDSIHSSESSLEDVLAESRSYGRSYARSSRTADWNRRIEAVLKSSYKPLLPSEQGDSDKGLVVAGIVLLSLGFLILLLVDWVIGLILMLLGGGLWIAGATKNKSGSSNSGSRQKREEQPQWQDVVYLKNGSVIKGMIIEQVPNESIKIQTADGSVFVYEMAQVTKIAKEQKQ